MVTIHDVATRAGVSSTTVSHVINKTRPVSAELRDRVEQAMAELGFQPNALARSLRRRARFLSGALCRPAVVCLTRWVEDHPKSIIGD